MKHQAFITAALAEDIGAGDFSTLASIDPQAKGKAILKIKEDGILAGMELAKEIFEHLEKEVIFVPFKKDGEVVISGNIAFEVSASIHTILKAERLVLNCMQRMSGIATITRDYVQLLEGYHTQVLDTRKTTPLFRQFEKEAVKIGGGINHRMGLYDMVMLKDNHIDFCGGIREAILKTNAYLDANNLSLQIEVETRSLEDVATVLSVGNVHRIMLDNFCPADVATAVNMIDGRYETEASGGINKSNILDYAATNVDFISVGALIHHAYSMDLSLKAQLA